ncbi:PASTA domain-containing protein [Oerskovia sp. M15]
MPRPPTSSRGCPPRSTSSCAPSRHAARGPPVDASAALALVRQTRGTLDPVVLGRRSATVVGTRPVAAVSGPPASSAAEHASSEHASAAGTAVLAAVPAARALETGLSSPDSTPTTTLTGIGPSATSHLVTTSPHGDGVQHTLALSHHDLAVAGPHGEDDDEPAPPRRRRAAWWWSFAIVVLIVGAATGASWWFLSGPGAYTTVPSGLVGAAQAEAETALEAVDLRSTVGEAYDDSFAAGTVISTDPEASGKVRKDGAVHLQVSLGIKMLNVPTGLVGADAEAATEALESATFEVGEQLQDHSDSVPAGAVLAVSVPEGSSQPHSTVVQLTVSQGPAPVTVPRSWASRRTRRWPR